MKSFCPSLYISESALISNYHTCRKLAGSKSSLWPVVKANGYGCSAKLIVQTLNTKEQLGGFFVAWIDETCSILHHTKKPIAVLHGFTSKYRKDIPTNIIPVLNNVESIVDWGTKCRKDSIKYSAIIQIDTGMNRLGLTKNDLDLISASPDLKQNLEAINILFCMNHYSNSSESNSANDLQLLKYSEMVKLLPNTLKNLPSSMAASGGIFLSPKYHGDIVRPGIALYGGEPRNNYTSSPLKTVINFVGRILKINKLSVGEAVGYGRAWTAKKPSIVATIGIGYADGINRNISKNLKAYYGDIPCDILGKVSMDSMVVDISYLSTVKDISTGATFSLINNLQDINSYAKDLNTIPYEILTSIGSRVERILQKAI